MSELLERMDDAIERVVADGQGVRAIYLAGPDATELWEVDRPARKAMQYKGHLLRLGTKSRIYSSAGVSYSLRPRSPKTK